MKIYHVIGDVNHTKLGKHCLVIEGESYDIVSKVGNSLWWVPLVDVLTSNTRVRWYNPKEVLPSRSKQIYSVVMKASDTIIPSAAYYEDNRWFRPNAGTSRDADITNAIIAYSVAVPSIDNQFEIETVRVEKTAVKLQVTVEVISLDELHDINRQLLSVPGVTTVEGTVEVVCQ